MPINQFIQQGFVQAAAQHPQNVALWNEHRSIRYDELDQLSGAFSSWLIERLPGSGHRIALVLPNSCDAVIAILGILRSGNTYVPLGDNWTGGRIEKICDDAQFALIITDRTDRELTLDSSETLIIGSKQWQEALERRSGDCLPDVSVTEESLAYILYTSGSTGLPKGVCVSHRAARYFPAWAREEFAIDSSDRIASVSPLTFDLSTFDLFTTLSAGATLYIVPTTHKVFPARLSEFLQTHSISRLYAVPSTLTLLRQRGKLDKRDLTSIKTILFAGEEFPVPLFRSFREAMPAAIEYCNLYGPTETNVCTYFRVPVDFDDSVIPIGRALPGMHLFLRPNAEESETGRGELCAAGPTVMSGYYTHGKNKSSTADYWLDDPRGVEACAYGTGDQASAGEDGVWHYHGRLDKMVKIWGYRVELGEVEACLMDVENVEQAVVVKRSTQGSGGDELVAFLMLSTSTDKNGIEPDSSISVDTRYIVTHCKKKLPPYMIPKAFNVLEALPVNNTGKVDRLRLELMAES